MPIGAISGSGSKWDGRGTSSGFRDRPYNALLAAAAQAGDPEGALQCLEKMKEKSLRVSVLTRLARSEKGGQHALF